jgi:hypothetical protein
VRLSWKDKGCGHHHKRNTHLRWPSSKSSSRRCLSLYSCQWLQTGRDQGLKDEWVWRKPGATQPCFYREKSTDRDGHFFLRLELRYLCLVPFPFFLQAFCVGGGISMAHASAWNEADGPRRFGAPHPAPAPALPVPPPAPSPRLAAAL